MPIDSATVKKQAKKALSQQWGVAILVIIIVTVLSVIGEIPERYRYYTDMMKIYLRNTSSDGTMNYSRLVSQLDSYQMPYQYKTISFIWGLMIAPLSYGMAAFFTRMIRNQRVELRDAFSMFRYYLNCIATNIMVALLTTIQMLLFVIPGVIAIYRYAMVNYIIAEEPKIRSTDAIKMSGEMMKGHKMELFMVQVSFIGWFILSMMTFGILFVAYVGPYYNATMAAFYDRVRYSYDCKCDNGSF